MITPHVRIPRRFMDDHIERALPTPDIVKTTKRHYWIRRDDPEIGELISDAGYYADPYGPGSNGLCTAAKALLLALANK